METHPYRKFKSVNMIVGRPTSIALNIHKGGSA